MKSFTFCLIVLIVCLIACKELHNTAKQNTHSEKIKLNITKAHWFTSTQKMIDYTIGSVNIAIKGKTNAEKLTVRIYANGRGSSKKGSDKELKPDAGGMFHDTIEVYYNNNIIQEDYYTEKTYNTILKAYLKSEKADTTLISEPLHF